MSEAKIQKHTTSSPFVSVHRGMLEDSSLSWKAKGILSYMLSKADDAHPNEFTILSHGTDGRDSVRSGIAELEAEGILIRKAEKNNDGRFKSAKWELNVEVYL